MGGGNGPERNGGGGTLQWHFGNPNVSTNLDGNGIQYITVTMPFYNDEPNTIENVMASLTMGAGSNQAVWYAAAGRQGDYDWNSNIRADDTGFAASGGDPVEGGGWGMLRWSSYDLNLYSNTPYNAHSQSAGDFETVYWWGSYNSMVPEPGTLGAISISSSVVTLLITGLTPTCTYTVQRSFTLSTNTWQSITDIVATGTETNWSETISNDWKNVFYRSMSLY